MENMIHKEFLINCSKEYFSQLFADKASVSSKFYSYTLNPENDIKNDWEIPKRLPELTFYLNGNASIHNIFKAAIIMNNGEFDIFKTDSSYYYGLEKTFDSDKDIVYYQNLDISLTMGLKLTNEYTPNSYMEVCPMAEGTMTEVKLTLRAHNIILMINLIEAFGGYYKGDKNSNNQTNYYENEGAWKAEWNTRNNKVDLFSEEKVAFFYNLPRLDAKSVLCAYPDELKKIPQGAVSGLNDTKWNEYYCIEAEKIYEVFENVNIRYLKKLLNANIHYMAQKNKENLSTYNEYSEDIDKI